MVKEGVNEQQLQRETIASLRVYMKLDAGLIDPTSYIIADRCLTYVSRRIRDSDTTVEHFGIIQIECARLLRYNFLSC